MIQASITLFTGWRKMTEYLLSATGSAAPIQNATFSFFVTTDPTPFVKYFALGVFFGIAIGFCISLLIASVVKSIYRSKDD
jgi:hypothetical protein